MGLTNVSAAASGGSTTTYTTACITSNTAGCTLESNFCGTLVAVSGGCIGIKVPGSSSFDSLGTAGEDFKDIFISTGTSLCYSSGSGLIMTGYLFDS